MNLLPIDELNKLSSNLRAKKKVSPKEATDAVLELLKMAYVMGTADADEMLETHIETDAERMESAVYKKIAGKTFAERISEYAAEDDIESIIRVADTEMQRDYNAGIVDTGIAGGASTKTWVTMQDDKVRDTHFYLDGLSIGINDEFYTFDGDHALHPGGFELPENNCNCRCVLTIKKE